MNIDNLTDDCLLYIFNLFNRFGTLLNCAAVCERWKHLVYKRLHNVKYLSDSWSKDLYPNSTIYFNHESRLEQNEISKWFPKLKILAVCECLDLDFISDLPVKGLRWSPSDGLRVKTPLKLQSIEMIAVSFADIFFINVVQASMLKQLYISECNISLFNSYAKYFPNLKRLHIENGGRRPLEDKFYTGPVFEKLEILELNFHLQWDHDDYYGFSLADRCPALKSASHYILYCQNFTLQSLSGIKNPFLEDLVLESPEGLDWPVIRSILIKYPNLKHLAIRGSFHIGISDENIPELLQLLPRITLIDLRDPGMVTEKSTEYIDWYCKRHNRSISLYYQKRPKITKKWPHLLTKRVFIGEGFDFMKYCFLATHQFPFLLDPVE